MPYNITDISDLAFQNNSATTNPSVNDDYSLGYEIGSRWVNTVSKMEYVCVDATVAGAIWKDTTNLGFVSPTPTLTAANYTALTTTYPAASYSGNFVWVASSQGVRLINYKPSGWYYSDGATWAAADLVEDSAGYIGVNTTGFTNSSATNLQTLSSDFDTAITAKVPTSRTVNGHALTSNVTVTKADIELGSVVNADTTTTANITDSTNKRFVTDANSTVINNTSGINTGNQTITLTGDVTGTGTGSFTTAIGSGKVQNIMLADATLIAFAGYNTNGILTQTTADTFTGRTITAGTNISISNGDGVSGNPTVNSTLIGFTQGATNSNTAYGSSNLISLTSGVENTGNGFECLKTVTTGFGNSCYGYQAGTAITSGNRNSLFGGFSGYSIVNGTLNIAYGGGSGSNIVDGSENTSIGYFSGANIVSGLRNVTIGARAAIGVGDFTDTLWIDTNQQSSPLLGGNFATRRVGVAKLPSTLTSTFEVAGSRAYSVIAKTTTYTATEADFIILVDAAGGSWTLAFPPAAGCPGRMYIVKKTNATNNVTLNPNASETIDGATTLVLSTQYTRAAIISDGTNWQRID